MLVCCADVSTDPWGICKTCLKRWGSHKTEAVDLDPKCSADAIDIDPTRGRPLEASLTSATRFFQRRLAVTTVRRTRRPGTPAYMGLILPESPKQSHAPGTSRQEPRALSRF